MEIKSRVTRFAGLLCIAGALQGIPVIYSANPVSYTHLTLPTKA